MSLAENLLNSLSTENISEDYSTDEEEHIVVDNTRKITVPAKLRTIAVEGDKNIETVTIDCVRYWDEHDLSSFAIYINYMLSNGETGTYIPENIIRNDDYFSFNWVIGRNLTKYSGSISFLIVARQTDSFGGVIYQWSSLLNSEFNVSKGLEVTSVPEENLTQDIISQILQSLNLKLSYSNISSSTGYEDDLVMSQRATTEELNKRGNAIIGNVSGAMVAMDDVSPLAHKVAVKITGVSDDTEVIVKSCGKNVFNIEAVAQDLISRFPNECSIVTFDGKRCLKMGRVTTTITFPVYAKPNIFRCNFYAQNYENSFFSIKLSTGGTVYINGTSGQWKILEYNFTDIFITSMSFYSYPTIGAYGYIDLDSFMLEADTAPTPYEPYKEGDTITTTTTEIELTSIAPNMTIFSDNESAIIDATYNKDTNKVVEKLTQAIISLGGTV